MGRTWHALAVELNRPAIAPVSRALTALGATGLQEDLPAGVTPRFRQPWDKGPAPRPPKRVLLRAWFDVRPPDDAVADVLAGWPAGEPVWTVQAEEDWAEAWKEHFQPVHVSDRLVVAAPWHNVDGAVLIEPGNAFGTGEHATTRACLRAVDRLARPGATLLDVGCGSGVLALAGAKLGMLAEGIDIDPDAVRASTDAAALNGLPAHFSTTPLADVEGPYDLVVGNLFAEVLVALAPELLRVAAGDIALAGILADRAHLVKAAFAERALRREDVDGDWVYLEYAGPCAG